MIDKSSVLFIQVIDTGKLESNSNKPKQFKNIESAINNLINTAEKAEVEHGCIKKYKLIQIDGRNEELSIFNGLKDLINNEIK